jgi:hypothetical protein
MAIWYHDDDGNNRVPDQTRAAVLAPELGDPFDYMLTLDPVPSDKMTGYGGELEDWYDEGGSTTWERPAASG